MLFAAGYQGRKLAEFVNILQGAGITRVIDVRALPLSRARGFSKTPLRTALAEVGIDYVHVRKAGNPYRKLRHDVDRCLALYTDYVDSDPSILDELVESAEGHNAALLCVEADPACCHRTVLLEKVREIAPELCGGDL